MAEAPGAARTPVPAHVRLGALAVFAVGLGLGFLGVLVYRPVSPSPLASEAVAAATGSIAALLPGGWFSRVDAPGSGMRAYLAAWGIVASVGLSALALVRFEGVEHLALFLLGLATGGSMRLAVWLALAMQPPKHSRVLLGLCGASIGLGGLAATLVAGTAVSASSSRSLLLCAATVPALLAFTAHRAGRLQFDLPAGREPWHDAPHGTGPRSAVLAASLLLQASACGLTAVWLRAYLSRELGLSLSGGAVVLAGFWLALAVGWTTAGRFPRIRENLAPLGVSAGLGSAGVLILFAVAWPPAAMVGVTLLGLGMGVLFPLALRLANWPSSLWRCRWIALSLQASLAAALLVGWPVGMLVALSGADKLLLAVVGCFAGALAALVILVGDYRITGDPTLI